MCKARAEHLHVVKILSPIGTLPTRIKVVGSRLLKASQVAEFNEETTR